jgi:anti-sigma factor RsiW
MNAHIPGDRLGDYLDGELTREEAIDLELHLVGCPDCREELLRLRRLTGDLSALPRRVAPARDLRPEIRSRLALEPATAPASSMPPGTARAGRRPSLHASFRELLSRMPGPAALAAVALLGLVTTTAIRWRMPRAAPDDGAPQAVAGGAAAAPGAVSPVAYRRTESRYVDAIGEMEAILRRERDRLSPETVRILERNLEVIDRAIAESRAALARDPGNAALHSLMISAYGQTLELLQRAREVST